MNASCARLERLVSAMSVQIFGKGKKVALSAVTLVCASTSAVPGAPASGGYRSNRHMVCPDHR